MSISTIQRAAVSGLGAAVANLGLYVVGRVGGVEFMVDQGAGADEVSGSAVAMTSFVSAASATMLLWSPRMRRLRVRRVAALMVAAAGIWTAGAPLAMATTGGSKVLLAAMHLVAAAVVLVSTRARWTSGLAPSNAWLRDPAHPSHAASRPGASQVRERVA